MKLHRFSITIILLAAISLSGFAANKVKLVILHTNDTHSQVEPTALSDLRTLNLGGYARRMGMIEKIRAEEEHVLLFDSGDFMQGTPYFNFFNGRIEIDAMNKMQYDAGTLGNHEFDNGMDTLATILRAAKFPVVCSNYVFDNTPLKGMCEPYLIVRKGGLKIGILGLGVDPESLIIENNYKGMVCEDAFAKANELSKFLKEKKKCDLVICLSHLGAHKDKISVNDYEIARRSSHIDIILGGHSHSMIENEYVSNAAGRKVCLAQMGKSGFYLGRIDVELEK